MYFKCSVITLLNLIDITLDSDSVQSLAHFWDSINDALMSTLQTDKVLPDFITLRQGYDSKTILVPASTDARYQSCEQAYNHFARTLHSKMTDSSTINKDQSPRAYNELQANRVNNTGFELLCNIIFSLSPHLGGMSTPSETLVSSLQIINGENYSDFHCRATIIHNEILLQQNKTGQTNELIGKYIYLLYNLKDPIFHNTLHSTYTSWKKFKLKYDNHLMIFNYTLQSIYNNLTIMEAPTKLLTTQEQNIQSQSIIASTEIPNPIVNTSRVNSTQHDTRYPGRQGTSYQRGQQHRGYIKPISLQCTACGLNNYDIIKGINKIHSCKAQECPFRGPPYMPIKDTHEQLIQFGLKNNSRPPKYDNNTSLQDKNRLKQPVIPKCGINFVTPIVSKVNGMDVEIIEDTDNYNLHYDVEEHNTDNEDDYTNTLNHESTLPDPIIGMGNAPTDSLMNTLINDSNDLDEIQA